MSFPTPVIRSSFIGRKDDLAALESLLERPNARLITVTGPGGVGKTRLVSEFSETLASVYPGGVWFVPIAHVHRPELVLPSIAVELGIRDLDAEETLERLVERLGGSPTLLVLDNLEQVVDCAPSIALLLQRCANLTILATSRQPLQLQGELEYPLRPLRTHGVEATESPAEELFLARAREASHGFVATNENREAIREIGQRLDGIPLAIELAASWVKVLPPQRLLENLDRQLDVLVRGARDLPERQQTMRSAISWSYLLLTTAERELFRQLSVLHGPFTFTDALAITTLLASADSGDWSELIALEALSSLVTKSLVLVSENSVDPAEPEYGMLEIIRAFAFEQLSEAAEVVALRNRHLAHFVELAEQWTAELSTDWRDRRLAQLDREYPNFRAALEWAVASGSRDSGLRLIASLWLYWDWRGFHAEGARWHDRILELDGETDPALLSSALYAGAAIAFMQANYARSVELAEACLAAAEVSGEESAVARGLIALGNTTYDRGDLDRAESVYARSLAMSRQTGSARDLQLSLVNLGFVYYQQSRFDAARILFEEACELEARSGHSATTAWAQVGLAQSVNRLGDAESAEQQLVTLIERQRVADTGQLGAALGALAAIYRAQGRLAEAEPLARKSVANRIERDERALLTDSLSELAALAICAGSLHDGIVLAAAVAAQRQRIGYGLPDQERKAHQEILDSARSTLGDSSFERAWTRGDRMTIAEANVLAGEISFTQAASTPLEPSGSQLSGLTRRELEVLRLIVGGKSDREIANELSISGGTASRHVANILHKLDVRTRSAAAAWAIRNGLT